ncbi:MAG: c-type cytochrome domain-containing protein, partial [Sediminibacterium sp.]
FGGSITHGGDYLSLNISAQNTEIKKVLSIDSISAMSPDQQAQINTFDGFIYPLLDAKCIQCHNSEKKKGNLQLTSIDLLLKGGKKGPAVVAYNSKESLMIQRMLLDPSDDKHMPPKGKPQLNSKEINLFYWWVQHGASVNDRIGNALFNDTVKKLIASKLVPAFPKLSLPAITLVDSNKINTLKQLGLLVHPIAKELGYYDVSAMNLVLLNDNQVQQISTLDSHLVWLNLASTNITNKSIATLALCKNLLKLNVSNTSLNDDAIILLNQFNKLNYLNIVGTSITDNGLAKLKPNQNLKSIYCWNTKISQQGVDAFKKRYPNIPINY